MATTQLLDRYGLPLTTASAEAVARYTEGLDRLLAYDVGAEEEFQAAIAADEQFALPHSGLAILHAGGVTHGADASVAQESAERGVELAQHATEREQRQAEIVRLIAVEQSPPTTRRLIAEHLRDAPQDALVLILELWEIFYGGGFKKREDMFALFDSLAPSYGDDWWFLSWYGFAHGEVEHYAEAHRLAERSLEMRHRNAGAAHTMAHFYFDTGGHTDGSLFLADWLDGYQPSGGFHCHLNWHYTLHELAQGRHRNALKIYDETMKPEVSEAAGVLGILEDTASLFWRCRMYGSLHAPLPWESLRDFVRAAFPEAGTPWADVHAAMIYAALGDDASIGKCLDELHAAAQRGDPLADEVVAPIVRALQAFGQEAYADAAAGLEAVHDRVVGVGGSNAQRDVFEETLLEAHLRAGQYDKAQAMLEQRLARRMTARDLFRLGRAQTGRSDAAAAASFKGADDLWSDADRDSPEMEELRRSVA